LNDYVGGHLDRTVRKEPVRIAPGRDQAVNSVGVRDLKAHASEILRWVEEEGETIDVTRRGAVIARLTPALRPVDRDSMRRVWEEHDRLAAEIAKHWPAGLSDTDAIADDRELASGSASWSPARRTTGSVGVGSAADRAAPVAQSQALLAAPTMIVQSPVLPPVTPRSARHASTSVNA
jgi:prevent-host-death family protein